MKSIISIGYILAILFTITLFTNCSGQDKSRAKVQLNKEGPIQPTKPNDSHIANYVRNMFEDKNGNFWFGTNGFGVAHYDGESVSYYSNQQGFDGQQITGISEDPQQNIWFATDRGIVKYEWSSNGDGSKKFINYTSPLYFEGQRFWSVFADSKGNVWGGAARGIYRLDTSHWDLFELPYPEQATGDFITKSTAWSITEDRAGNMWFSTNGYGVYKYDGQSFTQYSEEDGLTDNSVDVIIEDRNGNMWFGTRFGGVSRFDGASFVNYTSSNMIKNNEVCEIYEDQEGNIWFSSEGYGVYRYDASNDGAENPTISNFAEDEGLGVRAVQSIFQDRQGRLWVGGGGGLYRFDGERFSLVRREGPWD